MKTISLLRLAQAFAEHRGLKLSTVSTYAAADGKFFSRIANGSGCTVKRAESLVAWFDANWASDLEWPKGIERPKSKKEAA